MNGGEEASRTCPKCHSSQIWKDGLRKNKAQSIQRYICRDCEYRFSEKTVLINAPSNSDTRQVGVSLTGSKNLTEVEPFKGGLTGAKALTNADVKTVIFQYAWWLKKQGYAETTIVTYRKLLSIMVKRGATLGDPESIKAMIAQQE